MHGHDSAYKSMEKMYCLLKQEKDDLQQLYESAQNTIRSLQKQIQEYRDHVLVSQSGAEAKHKYTVTIKLLESTIKNQKDEIKQLTSKAQIHLDENKHLKEEIESLNKSIKEKELLLSTRQMGSETLDLLQTQLKESILRQHELEKNLQISKSLIEERFEREKDALEKVQEALAIAEVAVTEKNEALEKKRIIKDEADNLATSVSQILEEAALKVEADVKAMQTKYATKEKDLFEKFNKVNNDLTSQRKYNKIMETRASRFQQKLERALRENEKLKKELKKSNLTVSELELKLQAADKLKEADQIVQKLAEEHENHMQQYMNTAKQQQNKYKIAIEEVTAKFEKEIYRLQKENATLKAEKQITKLQDALIPAK